MGVTQNCADKNTLPPSFSLDSAIGAGDTFIAGTLFGLLCHTGDWDVHKMVRFAVDLATLKIQQDGFQGLASKLSAAG